ncbi:hypothetical protein AU194_06495 [Mycobacterium sp. GA-2829]|nr:hypothetical protein AU194_06495 [Mycobacterium sp. GA-2829]
MTGAGAWPETDESLFTNRAADLSQGKAALEGAKSGWSESQALIFNGPTVWTGTAAGKADAKVSDHGQHMVTHGQQYAAAIDSARLAAEDIGNTKDAIRKNVRLAQGEISERERQAAAEGRDAIGEIHSYVNDEYIKNFNLVGDMAERWGGDRGIPERPFPDETDGTPGEGDGTKAGEATDRPLATFAPAVGTGKTEIVSNGRAQRETPAVTPPTPVVSKTSQFIHGAPETPAPPEVASAREPSVGANSQPIVQASAPPHRPAPSSGIPPRAHPSAGAGTPPSTAISNPSLPGGANAPSTSPAGIAGSSGGGVASGSSSGGSPDSGSWHGSPSDGASSVSDHPSVDPSKGASGPSSGSGGQPQYQPPTLADTLSNFNPPTQPASAPIAAPAAPADVPPPAASAAPSNPMTSSAAHTPVAPVAPPPATAGGMPMSGGPAMPPPPMPLGPPPTPSPAAPVVPASAAPPPVAAPPSSAGSVVGAPAPVPVSAARAERDAIAGSMRRQSAGDPVQLARRVAAALNAVESMDFGFFWATGVTKDGTILVANSYGIGYVPEGVKLPDSVKMVSADESIPVEERAKWATFPMLALHGWAQHHDMPLRAVVATAEQFDGFDPGAARVILNPDDIPERGDMAGRSRLEIIAPGAARQLDSVADAMLVDLLPPAPADTTPPVDNSMMLWFDVMKPLMSTAADRGAAHLEAMVAYANHAQELALHKAQTAADAETQRAAIADWVYWQHISVVSSDAIVVKQ